MGVFRESGILVGGIDRIKICFILYEDLGGVWF